MDMSVAVAECAGWGGGFEFKFTDAEVFWAGGFLCGFIGGGRLWRAPVDVWMMARAFFSFDLEFDAGGSGRC